MPAVMQYLYRCKKYKMNIVETDICIVGSGMGGGTLALKLAEKGMQPLLIEAGNLEQDSGVLPTTFSGQSFGLERSRAVEVGGGTNLWHGVVAPLDARDFKGGTTYTGWPIDYEKMLPYWASALNFLGFENPALTHFEGLDSRLKKHANDIGYNDTQIYPKLFRVMGQPRRLKGDIAAAAEAGRLTLMSDTIALECIADAPGGRIRELIVGRAGARAIIRAKRFVISAGALETPRLLQNSRTFGPAGLGNVTGNVGKYLMDHPMAFLGKIKFRRPTRAPLFSDIRETRRNRFRIGLIPKEKTALLNSNLYLRPAIPGATPDAENRILVSLIAVRKMRDLSLHHVRNLLANPKVLYRIVANRYVLPIRYHAADLFFVTEQTPTPESRVSLCPDQVDPYGYPVAKVNWTVSDADLINVGKFIEILIADGLKSNQYAWDEMPSLDKWRKSYTSAAHHLGTARMAKDHRDGVVDSDLKIHGVENAWVCDGSVFPTGGNANPSLTICALALRLSEHLSKVSRTDD